MTDKLENTFTRRMMLKHSLVDTASLVLPAWVIGTYANWQRIRSLQSPESVIVPNLGLKIDQKAGEQVRRAPSKWVFLPESTNRENMACPSWSPQICMGYIGTTFKVAVNRPVAEFMFQQAKLTNPVLKTNIIFSDSWADDELGIGEEHTGGYTAPSVDMSEQITVIYLRNLAWKAFKELEGRGMTIPAYIKGSLSFLASSWLVHELGHAGAESRLAIKDGKMIPDFPFDRTHDQVYKFQDQYTTSFYNKAMDEKMGQKALLIGIEPTGDPVRLRDQIYREGALRGLK